MKNNLVYLTLILTLLSSCGLKDKEEVEDKNLDTNTNQVISNLKTTVFENEEISTNRFISNVKAGDRIHLTISGTQTVPEFSTYEELVTTTWKEKKCTTPTIGNCSFCYQSDCRLCLNHLGNKMNPICLWVDKRGTCNVKFKRYEKMTTHKYNFSEDAKDHPIKFKIGESLYPMGEVIEDRQKSKFSFIVTKEMLLTGDDLSFVIEEIKESKIKTGFIGYQKCPSVFNASFESDANTNFSYMIHRSELSFLVTLSIESNLND